MFSIEDYNYSLPEDLIAQIPASSRDRARLLVVQCEAESFSDHHFFDLPRLLRPGDLLVVNNTRVVPARLFGRKESGGLIEILVLEHPDAEVPKSGTRWCLLKSSKRPQKRNLLFFESHISGQVEDFGNDGLIQINFHGPSSIDALLEKKGRMPLPPYIKREKHDMRSSMDRERYQTVFAQKRGAVAAPTAGLHFTEALIEELEKVGVSLAKLTLHVGHGTFRPVRTENIRDHRLGEEIYNIDSDAAETINRAKNEGRRVIAVGTTVVRALETAVGPKGDISPCKRVTDLLITPGFRFRVVDGLITNFHLPKSSLLFLVSAFASLELIKKSYQWAIEKGYRFHSYGDAMLII